MNSMFLLIFVLALVFGLVGIPMFRERSTARATGMSDATPVCGQCHYRLGGWTSSTCPECGIDIRTVGVRTGPRTKRIYLGLFLSIVSIIIVVSQFSKATSWIFATKHAHAHGRYISSVLPPLVVTFETEYVWQRFPPKLEHDTEVHLIYFVDHQSGTWYNGRYVGSATRREQIIRLTEENSLSSDLGFETAIRAIFDPEVTEAVILAHTQAVDNLVHTMLKAQTRGELDANLIYDWSDDILNFSGNGGAGGGSGMGWLGFVSILVAVIFCVWFSVRIAYWLCKSGWRTPHDGEWGQVVG